jgi:hypothetical protein
MIGSSTEDAPMILGMPTFTFIHVVLSLVAIVAGVVVLYGLLTSARQDGWTGLFFTTMVATSATGFGFPFDHFLPSHAVGILSLIILALAIAARYVFQFSGPWRSVYVVGVVAAFYLDVFVAVVQAFQKIPTLQPPQAEPPFLITQLVVLVVCVVLGVFSVLRFHPRAGAEKTMPVAARH